MQATATRFKNSILPVAWAQWLARAARPQRASGPPAPPVPAEAAAAAAAGPPGTSLWGRAFLACRCTLELECMRHCYV